MPAPDEDLTTQAGWNKFLQRHGGLVGTPLKTSPDTEGGKLTGDIIQDPFYKYEMADGTTVEANSAGEFKNIDEKAPSAATGTKAPATSDWTGQRMQLDPTTNEYVLFGFDPADQQFKRVPTAPAQPTPSTSKPVTATANLDRIDAQGNLIPSGSSTPPAKLRDPSTGTVVDLPDPKTQAEGKSVEFGDKMLWVKPDGTYSVMLTKPGTTTDNKKIFQGPDGSQYEYDPTKPEGQRTTQIVAGEKKPVITSASDISWQDIPGTSTQQGGRIVDGQFQAIDGMTKPKASKLLGNIEDKQWAIIDDQGNPIKAVDNPAYQAKPPTTVTTAADQPFIVQRDPVTGVLSNQPNPNYTPKTLGDVAGRVAQVQAAAKAKWDELKGRVGDTYPIDKATSDFDSWWQTTVNPQMQSLQAQQEQVMYDRAQEEAKARQQAMQTAMQAGTTAVNAYNAQAPRVVGPGGAEMINASINAINKAGKLPTVDYSSLVTRQPNLQMSAEDAVNRALQHISPGAAAATGAGQPNYQGMDIAGALNQTNWTGPVAAPAGPAAPGGAPVAAQPTGWQRADQMAGTAPQGNVTAAPGMAGTVTPGSPNLLMGAMPRTVPIPPPPATWSQSMPNFGAPVMPWDQTQYGWAG